MINISLMNKRNLMSVIRDGKLFGGTSHSCVIHILECGLVVKAFNVVWDTSMKRQSKFRFSELSSSRFFRKCVKNEKSKSLSYFVLFVLTTMKFVLFSIHFVPIHTLRTVTFIWNEVPTELSQSFESQLQRVCILWPRARWCSPTSGPDSSKASSNMAASLYLL